MKNVIRSMFMSTIGVKSTRTENFFCLLLPVLPLLSCIFSHNS